MSSASDSKPSVETFLAELPDDRREILCAMRKTILLNLNQGLEEGIQGNMIGYFVPHSIYPRGYHCDPKLPITLACLASTKSSVSFHCMGLYGNEQATGRFRERWLAEQKRLDMGKACVRVKKLSDVSLNAIGQTIAEFKVEDLIAMNEAAYARRK